VNVLVLVMVGVLVLVGVLVMVRVNVNVGVLVMVGVFVGGFDSVGKSVGVAVFCERQGWTPARKIMDVERTRAPGLNRNRGISKDRSRWKMGSRRSPLKDPAENLPL